MLEALAITVNGGSSSIKFSVCEPPQEPKGRPCKILSGVIERIGLKGATLYLGEKRIPVKAANHREGAEAIIDHLAQSLKGRQIAGIGHRIVHGGAQARGHSLVTDELLEELNRSVPLDIAHLPREIALIETFRRHFPEVPQIACFDTAFFRDLPRLAQLLPIPRKYFEEGIRRLGFHGLSYSYLMDELDRTLDKRAADGRIVLAHLGSGASLAAIHNGNPVDTSMGFTPTAGVPMGARPGDIDPGLLVYLVLRENCSPQNADRFVNEECGLLGLSQTSSDIRDLLAQRANDTRAEEAIGVFCREIKKRIGAYAAVLGGLETLVFSGGIGEHAPEIREEICEGLGFLGVELDAAANRANTRSISAKTSRVPVYVIPTDEEVMIAKAVFERENA